jgi:hypothetical protein
MRSNTIRKVAAVEVGRHHLHKETFGSRRTSLLLVRLRLPLRNSDYLRTALESEALHASRHS